MSLRHFSDNPTEDATQRRAFIEQQTNAQKRGNLETSKRSKPTDLTALDSPHLAAYHPATENLIGTTQLPLSSAGPLKLKWKSTKQPKTDHRQLTTYLPLSTTEGALVASINRGCKAITQSGGATAYVTNHGITRAPVLQTDSPETAYQIAHYCQSNHQSLTPLIPPVSQHTSLIKTTHQVIGTRLYLRFHYDTKQAMGMNMATLATQAICNHLLEKFPSSQLIALSSNYCTDKKSSHANLTLGRGREVNLSTTITPGVIVNILKTTPQKLLQVYQAKLVLGSYLSGSTGYNSHFANTAAALYLACGQDPAHVVEASQGLVTLEPITTPDLSDSPNPPNTPTAIRFTAWIPHLLLGLIGGGTQLPTQRAALSIINHQHSVDQFAAIVGTAMLAGEISLLASLAENTLGQAHQKLGRKKRNKPKLTTVILSSTQNPVRLKHNGRDPGSSPG